MDEHTLHDDLVAISEWADPVSVPDTDHLDAHTVAEHAGDPRSSDTWRRVLLTAAATLLVIGGVWVLTGRDDPETVAPNPSTTAPSPSGTAGWVEVPAAPLLARAEAQVLWTGREFVVFAGTDQAPCPVCDYFEYGNTLHDAAAYDPTTNSWRAISDLPDASSYVGTSAVVDGDVYWLSVRDPSTNSSGIDATLQRWSSTDDTWTEVALPTDVPGNPRLEAVGRGLLLYPGTDEVGAFPDQLFDGTSWTSLPDDPISQAYDRQYLLVDGTLTLFAKDLQAAQQTANPPVVVAARYDVATSTWTRLADSDQLTPPIITLGTTAYAPLGDGADGGEVNNWGRTVPNGGSYSATDGWLPFPPTVPDDLMGVVSIDGTAVLGVQGQVLHTDDGTYSVIPTLPDGLDDQFGQGIANGDGLVFTFGGGLGGATGGLGVHARGFVWTPGAVDTSDAGDQDALDAALDTLGIDPARAPEGTFDLSGGRFCGYEELTFTQPDQVDDAARQCFAMALADDSAAMFVLQLTTTEGDPIAYVWRTADGRDVQYIDSTRDNFGSGEWEQRTCALMAAAGSQPFGCVGDGLMPASTTVVEPPASEPPTVEVTAFCEPAVALLESPSLFEVSELIADLRAVDTAGLSTDQRGIYLVGITALEDRVGSPDGYDTSAVTDAVNEICGTDLPTHYAMP